METFNEHQLYGADFIADKQETHLPLLFADFFRMTLGDVDIDVDNVTAGGYAGR